MDLLMCPICNLDFDDDIHIPKILPLCGHTICMECIQCIEEEADKIDEERPERRDFMCPMCRAFIDQSARSLPKNLIVAQIIDAKNNERPKPVKDTFVPCLEDADHESEVYCKNCEASYCESCFNSAHSFKAMSNHISIPVAQKPVVRPACPVHPDKKADQICLQPQCSLALICNQCFRESHYLHIRKNISAKVIANSRLLKSEETNLDFARRGLQEHLHTARTISNTYHPNSKEMIHVAYKIEEEFDNRKRKALETFDDWAAQKKLKVDETIGKYEEKLVKIQQEARKKEKLRRRKDKLHTEIETYGKEALKDREAVKKDIEQLPSFSDHIFTADMSELPRIKPQADWFVTKELQKTEGVEPFSNDIEKAYAMINSEHNYSEPIRAEVHNSVQAAPRADMSTQTQEGEEGEEDRLSDGYLSDHSYQSSRSRSVQEEPADWQSDWESENQDSDGQEDPEDDLDGIPFNVRENAFHEEDRRILGFCNCGCCRAEERVTQ